MAINTQIIDKINEMIINSLENGFKPWTKEWQTAQLSTGELLEQPFNLISKAPYQGINRLILSLFVNNIPAFLTFNQVKKLGGSVKKGAVSLPVIYFSKEVKMIEEENETKQINYSYIKHYNVFNIEDTTLKIGDYLKLIEEKTNPNQTIAELENLTQTYLNRECINVETGLNSCFYRLSNDSITMVPIENFKDSISYYGTLLHEMVHSSGHPTRLNRLLLNQKYTKEYAFEELIAETASAYLLKSFEYEVSENSASYVAGWIKAAKENKYFFLQAAKQAEVAAEFILGAE